MRRLSIRFIVTLSLICISASTAPGNLQPRVWLPVAGYQVCPSGVTVLSSRSVSDQYGIYVKGEICNGTSGQANYVSISANLFNGTQFVDTSSDYPWITGLRPGERVCFLITFSPGQTWNRYEIEPVNYSTYQVEIPRLSVTSVVTSYNPSTQQFKVAGMIRNDHTTTVSYPRAVVTTYNQMDGVTSCAYASTNATELTPGQSSAFSITYGDVVITNIARYYIIPAGSIY